MVDGVFVHRAGVGRADDVEFELGFFDLATPLADPAFDALQPDALDVVVAEEVEDRVHVLVELVDSVGLDLVEFVRLSVSSSRASRSSRRSSAR